MRDTNEDMAVRVTRTRSWMGTMMGTDGNWYSGLSIRHRHGAGDGGNFGLYLFSKLTNSSDPIHYMKQSMNWGSDRVIYDSEYPEIQSSSAQPSQPSCKIWIKV